MTESTRATRPWWPGIPLALASAALFGASTPFAKALVGTVDPWITAGLLYLGSGVVLALVLTTRRIAGLSGNEAPLRRADLPWLAAIVLTGGVAGPVLLMMGLAATSAATGSLLLNLESIATMAIAWIVFRENVDRHLIVGAAAILGGAVVLSWHVDVGASWGVVAITGACIAWGIDNNLTRRISGADPVQAAMVKGLAAGSVNLILGLTQGAELPATMVVGFAGAVGALGYGLSLVFFILALRHLGTARTGAYFATAPFIGALGAIALFGEPLTISVALAGLLMAGGVWLHVNERHVHEHEHEAMEHEHRHVHDEHHRHVHNSGDPNGEPHSHGHVHAPLIHSHAHYPDIHHRHPH